MLPPPSTGVKKLGATDHVMLGSGMPVATQVRVAGLVSFTTKVSSVTSTSGGSEQGGESDRCSQFCMHSTCHKLLRYVSVQGEYVHTSVDQTQAHSSCTVSIQQLALHEI